MAEIIVVGVDASETAGKAAQKAKELAVALGAKLHVITAYEGDPVTVASTASERAIVVGNPAREAKETAHAVAQGLGQDGLDVEPFVAEGNAAQAIISHAEKHGASLIVVGNRRMRGVARVLGSVANSVAHGTSCDVYIADTTD